MLQPGPVSSDSLRRAGRGCGSPRDGRGSDGAEDPLDEEGGIPPRRRRSCGALFQLQRAGVGQRPQPAGADQRFVDAAEPAAVGGVDGRAERGGLAVHRPAGGDDEVGEGDQALGLDGAGRDDQRGQLHRLDELPLGLGARQDDRVDLVVAAEPVRTFGKSGFDLRW